MAVIEPPVRWLDVQSGHAAPRSVWVAGPILPPTERGIAEMGSGPHRPSPKPLLTF
jgi:hypothetical protein